MTLPATGILNMSDVNVEIQREIDVTLTLNDTTVRALAKKPSSTISMSDLRGKTYLTRELVLDYMLEARNYQFQWCFNPEGIGGPATPASDVRFVNNPYARYVSSSTVNFTFPTDKHDLIVDSDNSTMAFSVTSSSASNATITVNDENGPVATTVIEALTFPVDVKIYLVRVPLPFKSIKSASVTWNRTAGNSGSWAACVLIPGYWNYFASGYSGNTGAAITYPKGIQYGASSGGGNGHVQMIGTPPADTARVTVDAAWYNNGGAWLLINPTAAYQSFPWTGGSRERFSLQFNTYIKP